MFFNKRNSIQFNSIWTAPSREAMEQELWDAGWYEADDIGVWSYEKVQ